MMVHPRRLTINSVAVALATAALACGDGSLEPLQKPPFIEQLFFESRTYYAVSPAEGVLIVGGPAAPGFVATAASDYPLELRTSSGDMEMASLRKMICGPHRGGDYWSCNRISIVMRDGHSAHNLYPKVTAMGARSMGISASGLFAGVQLFGMGLDEAVQRASTWPGVEWAGYSFTTFIIGDPREIAARSLNANIKLDVTSPIVGNGILEAMHGDTITARYEQPDGSVLTRHWILPTPPWED